MVKARTALDELGKDGGFTRKEAAWRNWISKGKKMQSTLLVEFFE